MGNSTPCKIITPENIILIHCTRDYVGEMTHHANFGFNRYSGGVSQIGEILSLCDFFDCPYLFSRERAQVEPLSRFSRFMAQTTCFCVKKCLLGVRTMGDVI